MVNPYKDLDKSKKDQVALMFNNIARKYDFLNHFLSMGIDKLWRRKAVKLLKSIQPKQLLDIATGTGDFALACLKLNPVKVTGIDISTEMLAVGREKIAKKNLQNKIELFEGDSENIQFADNSFDAITVAFGVRNFENLEKGLREMNRVVRPGGKVVILEFSKPKNFPVKQFYNFYFFNILPLWGKMVSKDSSAYTYLPESVGAFPDGENFLKIYKSCGFTDTEQIKLSFGIASIYIGTKPIQ
ncbi:bifunctional demethylmenaquinone methyltransferase/2-methoxy-6-polyprenyl-1,4-benzoquinol methylase [Labilibaculum filiforme]|uniref:Demethylmenaquinone methyltransferase n=1 Tax=Labilibaculum filiforme TaxID=1940526 RepID=A0A2N3HRI9_9BACT|nr:bifunctional demethylmenaquinone methyltransferase/2-methoxy-6-polyprenyl-1,4-benzoquinol methylase UbiE [Labilibaculum filiforme]PKQ60691.1 bifunctional demethylmenaquinone methyltransferase/2-methoxy-6-polyprenyl-1,4-benzoquinol methylase [Labilibaculum filiforme]